MSSSNTEAGAESLGEERSFLDEKVSDTESSIQVKIWEDQQKEKARAQKAESIYQACKDHDVNALVHLATSEDGLLEDKLRQKAWPIFLQCDESSRYNELKSLDDLPRHEDEDQVQLDVNRSFVYYPNATEDELSKKKEQLFHIIAQTLRNYPMLCYFQGYHDIVQVILLVLGEEKALSAMAQVSLFRIRDYMLSSLSPTIKHLQLIPAIIEAVDPALRHHLSSIQPFFALAATLTLYAHDIQEYSDIARLFDFILAREPVVSIYLFAEIILSRKQELLDIPVEEPEMLHFTLSKLPSPLDLDSHILSATQLFKDYPPESLPYKTWKRISPYSVLKTSRDLTTHHAVNGAIELFEKQTRQIQNEERRKKAVEFAWKYRKTIGSMAVAILVGAISFYIRKKGLDSSIWAYYGRAKAIFSMK